jgi:lysophospholipase L1-like esterase
VLALLTSAGCGGSPTAPPPFALLCPPNTLVSSAGGGPVPVTFALPSGSGGSGNVTVTCTPGSGALFSPGATSVACTGADTAGHSAACSFAVTVTNVAALSVTRFMTFGDSVTEGKLSLSPTTLVDSPSFSYPAKLLQKLRGRYVSQEITVLNEGLGGERVIASIGRFKAALAADHPEAVLLMHGINDMNAPEDGRIQSAVDALEELVKLARDAGLPTFVATLPPFGNGPKASCPECVEPYNERIRSMAAAKKAVLVDVEAAWGNGTGLMGADGIHPTEAGYEVIAEAFFQAIRRTLEKAPATP